MKMDGSVLMTLKFVAVGELDKAQRWDQKVTEKMMVKLWCWLDGSAYQFKELKSDVIRH